MSIVDVHAHLLFDELLDQAGPAGPRLEQDCTGTTLVTGGYRFGLGDSPSVNRDAHDRLVQLDRSGIDVQVVSASPLWYFPHLDTAVVTPFARRYNDLMAEWTQTAPDRLKALATVPVQDVSAAITEMERTVRELGFRGVCIGTTSRAGLDDPELDDLYAACVQLDVPLFIHSVVPGVDGPPGDQRLRRWLRDVTLGYPFEETIATTDLILGRVLERHPDLDVCISHGGGATPFILGRVRDWIATGKGPISVEDFDRAYARLWFDTHLHSTRSTELLTAVANPDRLVFGTNFGGWDSASPHDADSPSLDLTANARRLLRL